MRRIQLVTIEEQLTRPYLDSKFAMEGGWERSSLQPPHSFFTISQNARGAIENKLGTIGSSRILDKFSNWNPSSRWNFE